MFIQLFATPWTVACQAPLPMGFSRQEYWSGLPFPSPGDLPDAGIEPKSLLSSALAGRFSKISPANAGDIRDAGLIPGLGKSPGEGNGNPLQYSCLENPIDRGAWQAIVHGVAKSWTWLKQVSTYVWTWARQWTSRCMLSPWLCMMENCETDSRRAG